MSWEQEPAAGHCLYSTVLYARRASVDDKGGVSGKGNGTRDRRRRSDYDEGVRERGGEGAVNAARPRGARGLCGVKGMEQVGGEVKSQGSGGQMAGKGSVIRIAEEMMWAGRRLCTAAGQDVCG